MASKRHLRRRQCEGKITYTDESKAAAHAKSLGKSVGWYRCQFCSHWHVGHRPRAVRQSAAAKARNRRQQ